jgi:hypothetical protein
LEEDVAVAIALDLDCAGGLSLYVAEGGVGSGGAVGASRDFAAGFFAACLFTVEQ